MPNKNFKEKQGIYLLLINNGIMGLLSWNGNRCVCQCSLQVSLWLVYHILEVISMAKAPFTT